MKGDIVHKALWIAICVLASAVAVASSVKRPVAFDDLEGTRTDQTGTTTFLALTADARWLAAEKNGRLHVYDVKARRSVKDLGEGLNPAGLPTARGSRSTRIDRARCRIWVWNKAAGTVEQIAPARGRHRSGPYDTHRRRRRRCDADELVA